MNERIRELMTKAGIDVEKLRMYPGGWPREDLLVLQDFAELIVRECVDCARGAGLADDVAVRNGLGFNDGISEAVTHMKKHFGVEE